MDRLNNALRSHNAISRWYSILYIKSRSPKAQWSLGERTQERRHCLFLFFPCFPIEIEDRITLYKFQACYRRPLRGEGWGSRHEELERRRLGLGKAVTLVVSSAVCSVRWGTCILALSLIGVFCPNLLLMMLMLFFKSVILRHILPLILLCDSVSGS